MDKEETKEGSKERKQVRKKVTENKQTSRNERVKELHREENANHHIW
jgi:hypothetical protein